MYDTFSVDYDRFVNWEERLAYEMPFIENLIRSLAPSHGQTLDILDTACGTGMHAVTLAKAGHRVSAADLFPQMVEKGVENARHAGVNVHFEAVGLGDLRQSFGSEKFDLLLCLGNSLPHLITDKELTNALVDFARVLRPGGMLLIQNRNFDSVMRTQMRWMEPQTHLAEKSEWIFQRFYDFLPGGLIRFNIVTLKRRGDSGWRARVVSTLLRPQLHDPLNHQLSKAGFKQIKSFGSMEGEEFSAETSGNLILTAVK